MSGGEERGRGREGGEGDCSDPLQQTVGGYDLYRWFLSVCVSSVEQNTLRLTFMVMSDVALATPITRPVSGLRFGWPTSPALSMVAMDTPVPGRETGGERVCVLLCVCVKIHPLVSSPPL